MICMLDQRRREEVCFLSAANNKVCKWSSCARLERNTCQGAGEEGKEKKHTWIYEELEKKQGQGRKFPESDGGGKKGSKEGQIRMEV